MLKEEDMNVNLDYFVELIDSATKMEKTLSFSVDEVNKVIFGGLDSRVCTNSIKEGLYSLKDDLNKTSTEDIKLKDSAEFAFIIWSSSLNDVPASIVMNFDSDGTPWILKNLTPEQWAEINRESINFENAPIKNEFTNLDSANLDPDFKNYCTSLQKKYPFISKLSGENLENFLKDAGIVYAMSLMFKDYEKNRDQTLKLFKEIESLDNSIDLGKDYITKGYNGKFTEKYKNMSEQDLLDYYDKYSDFSVTLSEEDENEFESNIFNVAEWTYKKQQLTEEVLKLNGVENIQDIYEIENEYLSFKAINEAWVYNHIEKTDDFQEFLDSKDSDTYEPLSFNMYNQLFFNDHADFVTEEEMAKYEYLYYNCSSAEAEKYYKDVLLSGINSRKGYNEAVNLLSKMEGKSYPEQISMILSDGLQDGVEQFINGLNNLFNPTGVASSDSFKNMYLVSALENKIIEMHFSKEESDEIKLKLSNGEYKKDDVVKLLNEKGVNFDNVLDGYVLPSGGEQVKTYLLSKLYSAGVSIGNMVPAMALGTITGNPLIGSIAMGTSSAGNAVNDALSRGADPVLAYFYGLVTGVSETTIGYFLGKIPGLGKSVKEFNGLKTLKDVGNFLLYNSGGEALEEGIQFGLDTAFNYFAFGETLTVEEFAAGLAESSAMGFFVSLLIGGGQVTLNVSGQIVKIGAQTAMNLAQTYSIYGMTALKGEIIKVLGLNNKKSNSFQTQNTSNSSVLDLFKKYKQGNFDYKSLYNNQSLLQDIKNLLPSIDTQTLSRTAIELSVEDGATLVRTLGDFLGYSTIDIGNIDINKIQEQFNKYNIQLDVVQGANGGLVINPISMLYLKLNMEAQSNAEYFQSNITYEQFIKLVNDGKYIASS